jgi:putative MATE family efflux protein
MKKAIDLTQGPIFKRLVSLALPIIGTSLMQMAYNLTDMIWSGRLGSDVVASVGSAGFYIWLGISILLVTRIGAEVGVSQAIGRKEPETATRYARHSLFWALLLSLAITILTLLFTPQLIGVFRLSEGVVENGAISYLRIVSLGFVFTFINPTFQGIYNGMGNSRLPFYYLLVGLGLNMILDPLMIFGWGFVPALGVNGAAWATVTAQIVVFAIFYIRFVWKKEIMTPDFRHFKLSKEISLKIFKLGTPVAAQSALFAIFAMILARMITKWGDIPIAVQSIGAQIEAISWMTSSGFATALGTFTGQNYGAKNWSRIRKGYYTTLGIGIFLGTLVTFSFVFWGEAIFSLFLREPEPLQMGIVYLKILAVSQIFMIIEIITSGAFNGIGRTVPPSIIGIVFTGGRVPGAMVLSLEKFMGMLGIWWAISLSSVIKGVALSIWYMIILSRADIQKTSAKSGLISLIPSRIRQQARIKSNMDQEDKNDLINNNE